MFATCNGYLFLQLYLGDWRWPHACTLLACLHIIQVPRDEDVLLSQSTPNLWLGSGKFLPRLPIMGSPVTYLWSRGIQLSPFLIHVLMACNVQHLPSGKTRHVTWLTTFPAHSVPLTPKASSNGVGSLKCWRYCLTRLMRHVGRPRKIQSTTQQSATLCQTNR